MTPDGHSVALRLRERGVDNIGLQPVWGGAAPWSPDGRQIGVARRIWNGMS